MLNRRTFLQLIPLELLVGSGVLGQSAPGAGSPEGAARVAFELLKSRRVEDFIARLDPAGLASFRATTLALAEAAAREGADEEIREFFGVPRVQALRRLDPAEFFAAFWRGASRTMLDVHKLLGEADIRIVGHVREGRETAHVVYRLRFGGTESEWPKPGVVTLQQTDAGWALLMSGDVEGLDELRRKLPAGELPRVMRSTHRVLGYIADGREAACVVCRMNLSLGVGSLAQVFALKVEPGEPEWALLSAGDREGLERVINERHGMDLSAAEPDVESRDRGA